MNIISIISIMLVPGAIFCASTFSPDISPLNRLMLFVGLVGLYFVVSL